MENYDHKNIENNWKEKWYKDNIYEAIDFSPKPKKYILAELPYPSGRALHIGHAMRYTVPEVYSRYLRMKGFNVLFPMGWDAFGLPTEGYAIKANKTPQEVIQELGTNYKAAMQDMGYGIDWNREINTSDPKYYKWTQWLFLKFYENGLAEPKEMPVWWCPELGNLADEEVLTAADGGKVSERGGYKVEKKMYKQWVLKMPMYAEKLIQGLDDTDFPDYIKTAQKNWIDKKVGINITYNIENSDETVIVFTTRPDTNFGATFIVLAPESDIISKITSAEQKAAVDEYVEKAKNKSDMERIVETKVKTGVFLGAYAINPLTTYKMPIYVADYVLGSVGTGAVVGVPGHDMRDFEFAQKFNIPVIRVVVGKDGDKSDITTASQVNESDGTMINSAFLDGMDIHDATEKIMDYLEEKGWGKRTVTYKIRDWVFARQRYWGEPIPVVYKENGEIEAIVKTTDVEGVKKKLPLELPYTKDFKPQSDGSSALARMDDWLNTTDSEGKPAKRETQTMPTWAGSNWYFIRYIDPKNDEVFADFEKMKYWLPVDKYYGDPGHTTMHLLYSRFWYKFFYDLGLVPTTEPYKYRMTGGLLLGPDGQKMSKSRGNVVEPGTLIEQFGADTVRMTLCFIGPYEDTYPWNENSVKAVHKFINNIYALKAKVNGKESSLETQKMYNKMIKNVTGMAENLKMNTAVSEFMIFVNALKKEENINIEIWKGFTKVLAPFIPFTAEELWQEANGFTEWKKENSVHLQEWPTYDEKLATENLLKIAVQINGKVKDEVEVSLAESEDSVKTKVLASEKVKAALGENTIKKFIYVPGKIVNIVA